MKYNCLIRYQILPVDSTIIAQDKNVQTTLNRFANLLALRMDDTIAINDLPLTKALPESSLGDFVADAIRSIASKEYDIIDAAFVNYASIGRDYIAPGVLLRKDFYEIIPYENKMLVFSVNGKIIKDLCDSVARNNGIPISGIEFVINKGFAEGIKINNQSLKPNIIYNIAVNDYLINSRLFKKIFERMNYKIAHTSLRNACIIYSEGFAKEGKKIHYSLEKRISYVE